MNKIIHKVALGLIIFVVILTQSMSIAPQKAAYAAGNQANMSNIRMPAEGEEVGIWIDKFTIMLFNNVIRPAEGKEVYNAVSVEGGRGSGTGTFEYYNPQHECRKLKVDFSGYADAPTTGKFHYCGSSEPLDVRLEKPQNAKITGYYYEQDDTRKIFMPRYFSSIKNCGTTTTGGVTGEISQDGIFIEGEGGEFGIDGNTGNHDPKIFDIDTSDGNVVKAKQRKKSNCGAFKNDVSRYFPANEAEGTTLNYFAKDVSRDQVVDAATGVIEPFMDAAAKRDALAAYFDGSPEGRQAMEDCKVGAGYSGASDDELIELLVDNPQGTHPFVDCMYRELGNDAGFLAAVEAEAQSDFTIEVGTSSNSEDCAGGIPIISDLVCSITRWAFDVIYDVFTGVINFLAEPPEAFTQNNQEFERTLAGLRTVANLIFLLAFLTVVLQYMTNINVVDAYFVKKFVPRLMLAVVLVQASGWIVKELSYLFYDLGISIQSILFYGANISGNGFKISGGAATLAFFAGPAIGIILVIALIMLIVLVITVAVLSFRYVAILVLAMLSPLAFACIAIPQLEGLTKKWFKTYIQVLGMYPIIMLFLAASTIVGRTLQGGGLILSLVGIIIQFIPFIILPFTFKMAGGMMGKVGGAINALAKKGGKAAWNNSGTKADLDKFKGMRKQAKDAKSDDRVAKRLGKYQKPGDGTNPLARAGRRAGRGVLLRGMDEGAVDRYAGGFADKVDKREKEEAAAAVSAGLKGLTTQAEIKVKLKSMYEDAAKAGDKHKMSAAFGELVGNKAVEELEGIQQAAHASGDAEQIGRYNQVMMDNYSALKEAAPHLAGDISAGTNLDQMRADNFAKLNTEQLASMNADSWKSFGRANPAGAAAAQRSVVAAGGSTAAKLNPEAILQLIKGADKGGTGGAALGGLDKNELNKAYGQAVDKANKETDAAKKAEHSDIARKILSELSGRP